MEHFRSKFIILPCDLSLSEKNGCSCRRVGNWSWRSKAISENISLAQKQIGKGLLQEYTHMCKMAQKPHVRCQIQNMPLKMYQFPALLATNPQENGTALQLYKVPGPTHPVLPLQVAVTALGHFISRYFKLREFWRHTPWGIQAKRPDTGLPSAPRIPRC